MQKTTALFTAILTTGCAATKAQDTKPLTAHTSALQPHAESTPQCRDLLTETSLVGLSQEDIERVCKAARDYARAVASGILFEREQCSFGSASVCLEIDADGGIQGASERINDMSMARSPQPCTVPIRARGYEVLLISKPHLTEARLDMFGTILSRMRYILPGGFSLGQCAAEVAKCPDGVLLDVTDSCMEIGFRNRNDRAL